MATAQELSNFYSKQIPDASNMCFGIVVSERKADITSALLHNCVATLEEHGAMPENIHVRTVPSCMELVYGAHQLSMFDTYDAVIVLGCAVRGETPQFDFVCQALTNSIAQLNSKCTVPIIYGVLTTDTVSQASQRATGSISNKGYECAIDAIKMAKF